MAPDGWMAAAMAIAIAMACMLVAVHGAPAGQLLRYVRYSYTVVGASNEHCEMVLIIV